MIQSIAASVHNLPPSSTDTLKQTISKLETKVDSLQKVTERAEIGKDFFSDALSTNLTLFTALLGFLALVSWGFILKVITKHKAILNLKMLEVERKLIEHVDTKISDLNEDHNETKIDVCRAMYFVSLNGKDYANSVSWGLSCISLISQKTITDARKITINMWLDGLIEDISFLNVGDQTLIEAWETLNDCIVVTLKVNDEEINRKTRELYKELNHIVFSKTPPPEDLLDGNAEAPPIPTV